MTRPESLPVCPLAPLLPPEASQFGSFTSHHSRGIYPSPAAWRKAVV